MILEELQAERQAGVEGEILNAVQSHPPPPIGTENYDCTHAFLK